MEITHTEHILLKSGIWNRNVLYLFSCVQSFYSVTLHLYYSFKCGIIKINNKEKIITLHHKFCYNC